MKEVTGTTDFRTALTQAIAQLREAHVPSYSLAAELLLMHALECDRAWLYAHPDDEITDEAAQRYSALVARRARGESTQHLTGKQEFWGLEFEVSPDVLIPRPETEHLIEAALDRLALREVQQGRAQKTSGGGLIIADIGTGSGCIAIALAKELPLATIYATEVSPAALVVARRNAARHAVSDRTHFIECHLLDGLPHESRTTSHESHSFDLILSNPPYIGRREAATLPREVREHEPAIALFGGEEGHELYADLIAQAAARLKPGGLLVLELGHNSLPAVRPLFDDASWKNVAVTNDLAGIPRVIAAERSLASPTPKKL